MKTKKNNNKKSTYNIFKFDDNSSMVAQVANSHEFLKSIEEMNERIDTLEEETDKYKNFVTTSTSLIHLQRFILIMLPIVEIAIVGAIAWFKYDDKGIIEIIVIGVIGITSIINAVVLPNKIAELEKEIKNIKDNNR